MESSGTYNTGFANLMGKIYDYHPLEQYSSELEALSKNYRTTVYGFPMLVFHKHSTPEDKAIDNSEAYSDIVYEYIGKYNFNLDKSSNEYYGFELEVEQPYINDPWNEMGKRDKLDDDGHPIPELDEDGNIKLNKDGSPVYVQEDYVKAHHEHPWISQIAECWELKDNKGTWTSFRYPDEDVRENGFDVSYSDDLILEISKAIEPRYHAEADKINVAMGHEEDLENEQFEAGTTQPSKNNYLINETDGKLKNFKALFDWLDSTDPIGVPAVQTPLLEPYYGANKVNHYRISRENETQLDGSVKSVRYFVNSDNERIISYQDLIQKTTVQSTTPTGENLYYTSETDSTPTTTTTLYPIYDGYTFEGAYKYLDEHGDNLMEDALIPDVEWNSYQGLAINLYNVRDKYMYDTVDYRRAKFMKEFDQHFDFNYCLIYYILTELLLCYDSRGKNMMLASWGPTSNSNGNYVWFPIFYDIDTQLGLNNIGALLWDYDADATEDGIFSTANSVLWMNFAECYQREIEAKYKSLRQSNVLTSENIEGAYLCDPSVFNNSYAMKGCRPTVAYGLDEWYKYLAPNVRTYQETWDKGTDRRFGFYSNDATNNMKEKSVENYYYACQGDRKLSRSLFITNRLNYLDSKWLAGIYQPGTGSNTNSIMIRANANDTSTSDIYLERQLTSTDNSLLKYYPDPTTAPSLKYYNATSNFNIKPFLNEYLTIFYDEDPIRPVKKYKESEGMDYLSIEGTPSNKKGYKEVSPYSEQIIYIAGGDYLSDLGDLSLKYPSQFTLGRGKRLTTLKLGNDYPGYKNPLLGNTTFALNAEGDSTNKKELLKQIILTGIINLNQTLELGSCVKLQELRALNTAIPQVNFADGAPLNIIHLPNTLNALTLKNAKSLNKILTIKPEVIKEKSGTSYPEGTDVAEREYDQADKETYKGLYLEGITDYNESDHNGNSNFKYLDLVDVNLGYGSWTILSNILKIWDQKPTKNEIIINLENIFWCLYEPLPNDSIYNNTETYYELTVHNNFKEYQSSLDDDVHSQWYKLLKNDRIFTKNNDLIAQANSLTSLSFLQKIIQQRKQSILNENPDLQYFRGKSIPGSSEVFLPKITGTIFINNDNSIENQIDEFDLQEINEYFPNLSIYVNNLKEAHTLSFFTVSNGIEVLRHQIRFPSDTMIPDQMYESFPQKVNWKFLGWALNPEATSDDDFVAKYNEADNSWEINYNMIEFTDEIKDYNLYGIYEIEKFPITFKTFTNDKKTTEETLEIKYIEYGSMIPKPDYYPYTSSDTLQKEQRYDFVGWTLDNTKCFLTDVNEINGTIVDFTKLNQVTMAKTFYACYIKQSVYTNTTPLEFFEVEPSALEFNNQQGYLLKPKINTLKSNTSPDNERWRLKGKITIPYYYTENGEIKGIIIGLKGSSSSTSIPWKYTEITHIFFDKNFTNKNFNAENINSTTLDDSEFTFSSYCFYENTFLQYCEMPFNLKQIGSYAFQKCSYLEYPDFSKCTKHNIQLGSSCFNQIAKMSYSSTEDIYLKLSYNISQYGENSFSNSGPSDTSTNRMYIIFGTSADTGQEKDEVIFDFRSNCFKRTNKWSKITFYGSFSDTKQSTLKDNLQSYVNSLNNIEFLG